jgi:hypothetical protein
MTHPLRSGSVSRAGYSALLAIGFFTIGSLACGNGESASPAPELIRIESGNSQLSFPRRALPLPIVVSARDENGAAVPGVPVQFQVTAGGGYLSLSDAITSLATITDGAGHASARWVLGSGIGPAAHQVVVTRPGLPGSVTFFATGLLGPPDHLQELQGPSIIGTSRPYLPTLQVAIRDSGASTVTTAAATVLTVQNPVAGIVLTGRTATTQNGVASFPNIAVVCSSVGTVNTVSFQVTGGGLTGTVGFRVSGPPCP